MTNTPTTIKSHIEPWKACQLVVVGRSTGNQAIAIATVLGIRSADVVQENHVFCMDTTTVEVV
jgi:hypothetical protein